MDLEDCIKNRRSVRDYLDKIVEAEKVEKILNAGAMAPSAMNLQPWRFTVVEDKSKIRELSDLRLSQAMAEAQGKKAENTKANQVISLAPGFCEQKYGAQYHKNHYDHCES
ncbi:MAG: nitroreductase family protein [Candidatus Altiarchaeales archaeon]|nr:nitroreductase family protein [Candidatus Altiarchaeales archaeon]